MSGSGNVIVEFLYRCYFEEEKKNDKRLIHNNLESKQLHYVFQQNIVDNFNAPKNAWKKTEYK